MEGIRPIIADYLIRCKNWKFLFLAATCSVLICFIYRLQKDEPGTPSARALHLQTDHKKDGEFQVEKEMSLEDMSTSDFAKNPETLQNYSLYSKELQGVNPPRKESPVQREEDTKPTIDDIVNLELQGVNPPREESPVQHEEDTKPTIADIVNLIRSLSNLTASDVIERLTRNLNSTHSDLRDLYQKLHRFEEQEKCPACLAKRPVPVTFFGTEAKIEYNEFWEGYRLPVIISGLTNGRLGNQMGAYATIFAIKEFFNVTVLTSSDSILKLRKTFPRLSLPSLKKDDATRWILLKEDIYSTPSFISLQLAALGLLGPQNFVLGSYPFEYRLFHADRAKILQEFQFHDKVIKKANNYLRSLANTVHTESKQKPPVFVGVHVRLDDYTNHMAKVFGVEKLDYDDYLQRATNYFESLYDNVVFVVASDDVKETMKYFVIRGKQNIFFPSVPGFGADQFWRNSSSSSSSAKRTRKEHKFIPRLADEDMSLLSLCNHSIITLGTFGFFSAYLGSGKVLYPDINTKIPNPHTRVFFEQANLERFIPIPCKYLSVN